MAQFARAHHLCVPSARNRITLLRPALQAAVTLSTATQTADQFEHEQPDQLSR